MYLFIYLFVHCLFKCMFLYIKAFNHIKLFVYYVNNDLFISIYSYYVCRLLDYSFKCIPTVL